MKDKVKKTNNYIDAHSHHLDPEQEGILNLNLGFNDIPARDFSVGIHPWEVSSHNEKFDLIRKTAQSNFCKAIGETGLDRLYFETLKQQKQSTLEHIELAKKLNKPLIFHCVRAYQDLYQLLKQTQYKGRLMLHDYNGNNQITNQFLSLNENVFFSVGKRLFDSRSKLARSFDSLPFSRILIETDDQKEFCIKQIYKHVLSLRDDLSLGIIQDNYLSFIS